MPFNQSGDNNSAHFGGHYNDIADNQTIQNGTPLPEGGSTTETQGRTIAQTDTQKNKAATPAHATSGGVGMGQTNPIGSANGDGTRITNAPGQGHRETDANGPLDIDAPTNNDPPPPYVSESQQKTCRIM